MTALLFLASLQLLVSPLLLTLWCSYCLCICCLMAFMTMLLLLLLLSSLILKAFPLLLASILCWRSCCRFHSCFCERSWYCCHTCCCCCLRHCRCEHSNSGRYSCCCWLPSSSFWVTVPGISATTGIPGVASFSTVPFKLAYAGDPDVTGFPAVDGVLAVANCCFTYWTVQGDILLDYRTIRLWLSICYFFLLWNYRNIKYRIGKFKKLSNYWISDLGLNLSDYRISDSEKNYQLPTSYNFTYCTWFSLIAISGPKVLIFRVLHPFQWPSPSLPHRGDVNSLCPGTSSLPPSHSGTK